MANGTCPNCNSYIERGTYRCNNCGYYSFPFALDKYNVPAATYTKTAEDIKSAISQNRLCPGVYIFNALVCRGEIPLRVGNANYRKSIYNSIGGKLLLTERNLYFVSHGVLQKANIIRIALADIVSAVYSNSIMNISDVITVSAGNAVYEFIVYEGHQWVNHINTQASIKSPTAAALNYVTSTSSPYPTQAAQVQNTQQAQSQPSQGYKSKYHNSNSSIRSAFHSTYKSGETPANIYAEPVDVQQNAYTPVQQGYKPHQAAPQERPYQPHQNTYDFSQRAETEGSYTPNRQADRAAPQNATAYKNTAQPQSAPAAKRVFTLVPLE